MDLHKIRNNAHRGYTMPHKELMDEMGLKYEDLSEYIKSSIRLFEEQYDQSLNSDGYLDIEEESELITASVKIEQDIKKWSAKDENNNGGKVATAVTLTLFGLIGLALGIKNLRE